MSFTFRRRGLFDVLPIDTDKSYCMLNNLANDLKGDTTKRKSILADIRGLIHANSCITPYEYYPDGTIDDDWYQESTCKKFDCLRYKYILAHVRYCNDEKCEVHDCFSTRLLIYHYETYCQDYTCKCKMIHMGMDSHNEFEEIEYVMRMGRYHLLVPKFKDEFHKDIHNSLRRRFSAILTLRWIKFQTILEPGDFDIRLISPYLLEPGIKYGRRAERNALDNSTCKKSYVANIIKKDNALSLRSRFLVRFNCFYKGLSKSEKEYFLEEVDVPEDGMSRQWSNTIFRILDQCNHITRLIDVANTMIGANSLNGTKKRAIERFTNADKHYCTLDDDENPSDRDDCFMEFADDDIDDPITKPRIVPEFDLDMLEQEGLLDGRNIISLKRLKRVAKNKRELVRRMRWPIEKVNFCLKLIKNDADQQGTKTFLSSDESSYSDRDDDAGVDKPVDCSVQFTQLPDYLMEKREIWREAAIEFRKFYENKMTAPNGFMTKTSFPDFIRGLRKKNKIFVTNGDRNPLFDEIQVKHEERDKIEDLEEEKAFANPYIDAANLERVFNDVNEEDTDKGLRTEMFNFEIMMNRLCHSKLPDARDEDRIVRKSLRRIQKLGKRELENLLEVDEPYDRAERRRLNELEAQYEKEKKVMDREIENYSESEDEYEEYENQNDTTRKIGKEEDYEAARKLIQDRGTNEKDEEDIEREYGETETLQIYESNSEDEVEAVKETEQKKNKILVEIERDSEEDTQIFEKTEDHYKASKENTEKKRKWSLLLLEKFGISMNETIQNKAREDMENGEDEVQIQEETAEEAAFRRQEAAKISASIRRMRAQNNGEQRVHDVAVVDEDDADDDADDGEDDDDADDEDDDEDEFDEYNKQEEEAQMVEKLPANYYDGVTKEDLTHFDLNVTAGHHYFLMLGYDHLSDDEEMEKGLDISKFSQVLAERTPKRLMKYMKYIENADLDAMIAEKIAYERNDIEEEIEKVCRMLEAKKQKEESYLDNEEYEDESENEEDDDEHNREDEENEGVNMMDGKSVENYQVQREFIQAQKRTRSVLEIIQEDGQEYESSSVKRIRGDEQNEASPGSNVEQHSGGNYEEEQLVEDQEKIVSGTREKQISILKSNPIEENRQTEKCQNPANKKDDQKTPLLEKRTTNIANSSTSELVMSTESLSNYLQVEPSTDKAKEKIITAAPVADETTEKNDSSTKDVFDEIEQRRLAYADKFKEMEKRVPSDDDETDEDDYETDEYDDETEKDDLEF